MQVFLLLITLVSGQASDAKLTDQLSRLVAVLPPCMGFFRDANSFVAPASCFAGTKPKFRRYINAQSSIGAEVSCVFMDTRYAANLTFNKAIAFTASKGEMKDGSRTELKAFDPALHAVPLHVVTADTGSKLQVQAFTPSSVEDCNKALTSQPSMTQEAAEDLFCAKPKASGQAIAYGAPAFTPNPKAAGSYLVAGIHVGEVQGYNVFSKVHELF